MNLKKSILIIGANSDIARSVAYRFAKADFNLLLASRNEFDLHSLREDLAIKFSIKVNLYQLDILDLESFPEFIDRLDVLPDIIMSAVGLLGIQESIQEKPCSASLIFKTNFEGPAIFLENIAKRFAERGNGVIIGISSVAGERGRQSNYFYGSSKAGFTAFLSGLRNRLSRKNIQVITIIPGFVNTKMIKNINTPKFLTSEPKDIANKIYKATQRNQDIVFSNYKWSLIMQFIKLIPEKIFKRLKL
jgi:short-subunit dehydrogenase